MQDFTITKDQNTLDFSPAADSGPRILLEGYTPAVAELDTGLLGNKSEYLDVEDSARFIIKGTSPADVRMQTLELRHLLDHAHRWKLNQNITPLLLGSRPEKSTLTEIPKAAILGPPDNQQSIVLPTTFTEKDGVYSSPITMKFKRRGLWLMPDEASTPSLNTPLLDKATTTWLTPMEDIPAPVNIRLDFNQLVGGSLGGWFNSHAYLLVSEQPDDIVVVTDFGSVDATDDSDKLAAGNGLVVYKTGWPGTQQYSAGLSQLSHNPNITAYDVYATVKAPNNTAWNLTAMLGSVGTEKESKTLKILYSGSGLPEPIYIGQVESNAPFEEIILEVESVVAVETDTFALNAIVLHGRTLTSSSIKIFPHTDNFSDWRIDIKHNLLAKPRPEITSRKTLVGLENYAYVPTNRRGNIFLHTIGNQITATMLATGGQYPENWQWSYTENVGYTQVRGSFTLSAWRNQPYLFPV